MFKSKNSMIVLSIISLSLFSANAVSGVLSSVIGFTTSKISHNNTDGKIASDIYSFLTQNNEDNNEFNNQPNIKIIGIKTNQLSGKKYLIAMINGVKTIYPIVHGKIVFVKNLNSPSL